MGPQVADDSDADQTSGSWNCKMRSILAREGQRNAQPQAHAASQNNIYAVLCRF